MHEDAATKAMRERMSDKLLADAIEAEAREEDELADAKIEGFLYGVLCSLAAVLVVQVIRALL
jgi:hypothetical protein